jgi:hypothetical protein
MDGGTVDAVPSTQTLLHSRLKVLRLTDMPRLPQHISMSINHIEGSPLLFCPAESLPPNAHSEAQVLADAFGRLYYGTLVRRYSGRGADGAGAIFFIS